MCQESIRYVWHLQQQQQQQKKNTQKQKQHCQAFPLSKTTNKTKKMKLDLFKEITKNILNDVGVEMTNCKQ